MICTSSPGVVTVGNHCSARRGGAISYCKFWNKCASATDSRSSDVMPEHIHLLISEPEHGTPSTVVQAIKLGFARRVLGPRKVAVAQTSRGVPHVSRFLRDVGGTTIGCIRGGHRPPSYLAASFLRFQCLDGVQARIEKLGYMHRNPVKRGLVAEPDQWTWSSFRAYLYGEPGPVRVNYWEVLDKIDLSRASA